MNLSQSLLERIEWRCSTAAYNKFKRIMEELAWTESDTDEWHVLVDQIRSLPGFPYHALGQEDRYYITPVVTTEKIH